MVRECRHLGTGKSSFPSSRRWPGSGARPLAIRRPDGAAKAAGPRAGPAQPAAILPPTAPRPSRGATSLQVGDRRTGPSRRRRACTLHMAPPRSPTGQTKALPAEGSPPPKERKAPLPRSPTKSHSAEERPAPREPAGNQPSGNQRLQEGRHGRLAVGVGAGQGQSPSPPLVASQSAGRSYRHRSRRAPRPLKKSARARLAAEGKLGPLTPAVEIRE